MKITRKQISLLILFYLASVTIIYAGYPLLSGAEYSRDTFLLSCLMALGIPLSYLIIRPKKQG